MKNDAKAAPAKPCAAQKYTPPRIAFEGDEAGHVLVLEGNEQGKGRATARSDHTGAHGATKNAKGEG